MTRRRAGLVIGLLAASFALSACGLLFEFDHYDTGARDRDATPSDASSADVSGSFDLLADPLTVAPGTTAYLPVVIVRHGDEDARVVVSAIVTDTPSSVAPILAVTVEPNASTAALGITVPAVVSPGVVTLAITATDGTQSITKDVPLTLRGASCTPDLGFGAEHTGVVHLNAASTASGTTDAFFVATDDTSVTLAARSTDNNGPVTQLLRLDPEGILAWDVPSTARVGVAAADADGGTFTTYEGSIRHLLPNGQIDSTFADAGVPCVPVSFETRGAPALAMLCLPGDSGNWSLSLVDHAGVSTSPVDAPFRPPAAGPSALHSTSAGFVACGAGLDSVGNRHPAFSRWTPGGAVDRTFGDGGASRLDAIGDVDDCFVDEAGAVAFGGGKGPFFFGIRADGSPDPAFGDGGARQVSPPTDVASETTARRIVGSGPYLFAIVTPVESPALLTRFDRKTGQLDTSFGASGYCALAPFALGRAAALALTGDGKIVVLANGVDELIVGRLWL